MLREKKRLKIDLRRTLFVLPNLFTVTSIFLGVYAICLSSMTTADTRQFYLAGLMIFLAALADTFDGRVARLTRTQSEFGLQMDSLADVISFGVAPAVLVYRWGLSPLIATSMPKFWIFMPVGLYVACAAIRLARFNLLATHKPSDKRYFIGMPTPVAAGCLVSIVVAHYSVAQDLPVSGRAILLLLVVLSYLMVSRIRFRTFKDLRLSTFKGTVWIFLGAVVTYIVAVKFQFTVALVALFAAYVFSGLMGELIRWGQRGNQAPLANKTSEQTTPTPNPDPHAPTPPASKT